METDNCFFQIACFNVSTGDVEDAPAPDPLGVFSVSEKDGAVYVKGEQSTIKNGRRSPNTRCSAQKSEKVVIVGGSVIHGNAPMGLC